MTEIPARGSNVIIKKKGNTFSILIVFLESGKNFVHFENKVQFDSLNILEVINSEKFGYYNTRKLLS